MPELPGGAPHEEAEEAAGVDHVRGAAVRPLVLHTNARRMRGVCVDVGDMKNLTGRARKNVPILNFQILF